MAVELTNSSVVIAARDVNVSIFTPDWLRKNILTEAELSGQVILVPMVVRIPTERFELLILPDRIQMQVLPEYAQAQGDLLRVLGGIANILPHTPFSAVGLNYELGITPSSRACFGEWNRNELGSIFARKLADSEGTASARFGSYVSFESDSAKVRIEIKSTQSEQGDQEGMQAKFNFHHELTSSPASQDIRRAVERWEELRDLSLRLARSACSEDQEG